MFIVLDNKEDVTTLKRNLNKSISVSNINEFLAYCLKNDLPENIGITGGINTPIKEIKNYTYLLEFIVLYKKINRIRR